MMHKFRTGQFGAPVPSRGIGVPMNASVGTLGRMTYFGPEAFGTTIPQERAAIMHAPTLPPEVAVRIYNAGAANVVTGGNLPPQVVPKRGGVGNIIARMLAGRRYGGPGY